MTGEVGPALKGWIGLGALVGLAAPVLNLAIDGRDREVRAALVPSLAVLGAQATVERQLGADRQALVRAVGAIGTVARLGLYVVAWRGPRRRLHGARRRRISLLLGSNLVFWSANLAVLGVLGRRAGRRADVAL